MSDVIYAGSPTTGLDVYNRNERGLVRAPLFPKTHIRDHVRLGHRKVVCLIATITIPKR